MEIDLFFFQPARSGYLMDYSFSCFRFVTLYKSNQISNMLDISEHSMVDEFFNEASQGGRTKIARERMNRNNLEEEYNKRISNTAENMVNVWCLGHSDQNLIGI